MFDTTFFQVKRQLENLDTIRAVSVESNTTSSELFEWTVTFDTELGDLPMLEITSGRLTGTVLLQQYHTGTSEG